ncbi:hypothetical protein [Massilia sp. H6]|uniref:hypothetical protein n=1 Tax=Massilia sp. H6 TaxID=2970464 RepID=UPI002167FD41|nr:hypothetical protein [Massilia sp. H6]UVW29197.1 hypothetical protein NRS07_03350 [Massilia sp. H6]
MSFGLSSAARGTLLGGDSVDKSSDAYGYGENAGVVHSLAFGGVHLGKNVLYQMGKKTGLDGLQLGLTRIVSDARKWGSVRSMWSTAAGGGKAWLKANGQSLHHWLIPQRMGQFNAGFNYMPISAGFNSWMNGATATRNAVEVGFRGTVLGIYGAPATKAVSEATRDD